MRFQLIDRDNWQEILSTMRKNKLRTALTALGVFWGIFMLVFLLGMGDGLESGVFRNFGSGAKNIMYVWANKTTIAHKGFSPGRNIRLTLDDAISVKENIEGVDRIAPSIYMGSLDINYGQLTTAYELRGVYPDSKVIDGYILDEGRYVNNKDIDDARKTVVLGRVVKKELFGDSSAVGKHVRVSGIDFQVVGVFGTESTNEWDQEDMEAVAIPLTTTYKTFGIQNQRVHRMIVGAADDVAVSEIEEKVRKHLRERHSVAPNDKSAIGGFNLEEEFKSVKNLFFGINALLWFVGIGTLIAGIVGVSNIMLITVKERTKEIGVRKALGASPGSIVKMILTESIFITSAAGYLGLLFGTMIIIAINYMMMSMGIENENFYNPQVNFGIAISSLIFLISAGTIAGLIPALHASRINPVDALKDE